MLINIVLWVILVALIALIPCGCILTRPGAKGPPSAAQ